MSRKPKKNKVTVVRSLHGLSHKAAVTEAMKSREEIARLMNELERVKERSLVDVHKAAEDLIATRLETGEYVTKESYLLLREESDLHYKCFEQHGERICELELEKRKPIPMRLTCPDCGSLHIDEGTFATKVHHTHACQTCGNVWRPAVHATVGVRFLPGFKGPIGNETVVDIKEVTGGSTAWISDYVPPGNPPVSGKWVATKVSAPNDDSAIGISADKAK